MSNFVSSSEIPCSINLSNVSLVSGGSLATLTFTDGNQSKEYEKTEGYIFVNQDLRGRFGSEGQFVMMRPAQDKSNPKNIDEGTDTNDTVQKVFRTAEYPSHIVIPVVKK